MKTLSITKFISKLLNCFVVKKLFSKTKRLEKFTTKVINLLYKPLNQCHHTLAILTKNYSFPLGFLHFVLH